MESAPLLSSSPTGVRAVVYPARYNETEPDLALPLTIGTAKPEVSATMVYFVEALVEKAPFALRNEAEAIVAAVPAEVLANRQTAAAKVAAIARLTRCLVARRRVYRR